MRDTMHKKRPKICTCFMKFIENFGFDDQPEYLSVQDKF